MSKAKEDLPRISLKNYRACLRCRRVQTLKEFSDEGCRNCGTKLGSTTPTFYGMLALMAPRESWVAQWQNQSSLEPGMYAVAVAGVEAADGRGDDEDDVDMDEDV